MKKYIAGSIAFGILSGIVGLAFIAQITSNKISNYIPIIITLIVFIALFIFNLVSYSKTKEKNDKTKKKNNNAKENKPLKPIKPSAQTVGMLIDGLPVPASVPVAVYLYENRIDLEAVTRTASPNQKFSLDINKIQRVSLLNESQVQQVIKQSAPGMIIGAAAFGVLGAMIGGRVKTKQTTVISHLLLIDYTSDGESKQILLNVSNDIFQATTFAKKVNSVNPHINQTVQL